MFPSKLCSVTISATITTTTSKAAKEGTTYQVCGTFLPHKQESMVKLANKAIEYAKEFRFWQRIKKVGDCWLWNGAQFEDGYGQAWINGKPAYVHRHAYELSKGKIPKDHDVKRTCNNRLCINPEHLYLYKYNREDQLKLFWNSIEKQESGCWLWTGTPSTNGYGQMYIDNTTKYAHRIMWEIVNDVEQPRGYYLKHTCKNKKCVNPEHLFIRAKGNKEESGI